MSSVFNVSSLGIKNFSNLSSASSSSIKDDIKNNRVLITSNPDTLSYQLILPTENPKRNVSYLVSDDTGQLSWGFPTAGDTLPSTPEGPPLIYKNGEYKFSKEISKMTKITGDNISAINFNNEDDSITINTNNSFFNLFSNIITLGFNGMSSIDIMSDKIIINKPLIIGNYKLEVINDELIITKYDSVSGNYIPGVVII